MLYFRPFPQHLAAAADAMRCDALRCVAWLILKKEKKKEHSERLLTHA